MMHKSNVRYRSFALRNTHIIRRTIKYPIKIVKQPTWKNRFFYPENIKDFLSRITIAGVSQWFNHRSFAWKIIWAIVTLCGLAIASQQSAFAILSYTDNAVVQLISFETKEKIRFPALTFCTNILVDYNKSFSLIEPTIREKCNKVDVAFIKSKYLDYRSIAEILRKYRTDIMNELKSWNDLNRAANVFGNDILFTHCRIKNQPCNFNDKNVVVETTYLRYGKCMKFNPGLEESKIKKAKAGEGLIVVMDMNVISRLKPINSNYGILIVHPAGVPPIPKAEHVIHLFPGTVVQVFVKSIFTNRVQAKHIKKCVDTDSIPIEGRNEFYYTERTPYNYSYDGCLMSCRFQYTMLKSKDPCLDPNMPLPILLKKGEQHPNLPICNYSDFLSVSTSKKCKCRKPCKEPMLNPESVTFSVLKTPANNDMDSLPNSAKKFNKFAMDVAIVEVYVPSTHYMRVSEKPMYSTTDLFGLVGGNLSLWVGANVLCLVELIELLVIVIQKYRRTIY